jgi:hypothetical protein
VPVLRINKRLDQYAALYLSLLVTFFATSVFHNCRRLSKHLVRLTFGRFPNNKLRRITHSELLALADKLVSGGIDRDTLYTSTE